MASLLASSESEALAADSVARPALDRPLSFSAYGVGWAGAYAAGGLGGRLSFGLGRWVGVGLFGEALVVDVPGGLRHDHPIGFDLFVPVRLGERVRLRPEAGMCAVFSLHEPERSGAPRSDDVLFGLHAGLGLDVALASSLSVFADVKALGYLGHERVSSGWTGAVGGEYTTFGVGQASLGVTLHVDP